MNCVVVVVVVAAAGVSGKRLGNCTRWARSGCAAIATSVRHAHASELAGALDALFDWFDRRGCRAIDAPLVSIGTDAAGLRTEILWAFEQAQPAR